MHLIEFVFYSDSNYDILVHSRMMLNRYQQTNTGIFISSDETGTDPLIADTDGDGFNDGVEVGNGTDPLDITSLPDPDGDLAPHGSPDGVLNAADILIATRFVVGGLQPDSPDLAHGDMNNNGVIDPGDLILIIKAVLQ